SSHILFELAEMCTHVAILQDGQLVASGDVEGIIQQVEGKRQLDIHILQQERLDDAIALLNNIPTISRVTFGEKKGILADSGNIVEQCYGIIKTLLLQYMDVKLTFSFDL